MERGTTARWMARMVVAVGVFVVLVGLATLVGMPWRFTAVGGVGAGLQILGIVASLGVGVGLAWLGVQRVKKK